MGDEKEAEILTALGLAEVMTESPERRFERRLLAVMLDARRASVDYWRLFELVERQQRAAIRASFSHGEFGDDIVFTGDTRHCAGDRCGRTDPTTVVQPRKRLSTVRG